MPRIPCICFADPLLALLDDRRFAQDAAHVGGEVGEEADRVADAIARNVNIRRDAAR